MGVFLSSEILTRTSKEPTKKSNRGSPRSVRILTVKNPAQVDRFFSILSINDIEYARYGSYKKINESDKNAANEEPLYNEFSSSN